MPPGTTLDMLHTRRPSSSSVAGAARESCRKSSRAPVGPEPSASASSLRREGWRAGRSRPEVSGGCDVFKSGVCEGKEVGGTACATRCDQVHATETQALRAAGMETHLPPSTHAAQVPHRPHSRCTNPPATPRTPATQPHTILGTPPVGAHHVAAAVVVDGPGGREGEQLQHRLDGGEGAGGKHHRAGRGDHLHAGKEVGEENGRPGRGGYGPWVRLSMQHYHHARNPKPPRRLR